jgi:hypothetical protein
MFRDIEYERAGSLIALRQELQYVINYYFPEDITNRALFSASDVYLFPSLTYTLNLNTYLIRH